MPEHRKLVLIRVISAAIGVIYIAFIPKEGLHFHDHVMFILLTFCSEQLLEQALVGTRGPESPVNRMRGTVGKCIARIEEVLGGARNYSDNYYEIRHPDLAIWSYYEFWKTLVAEQQRLKGQKRSLVVQAMHSCQMNIWTKHPYAGRIREAQRQFIEHGGQIIRVLCGKGDLPDGEALEAAQSLIPLRVATRYYNVDRLTVNHAFGWDFLRVDPSGDVVIWAAPGAAAGGIIDRARYQRDDTYETTNLGDLWSDLLAASKELELKDGKIDFKVPAT
jgi:hypothetical protein